MNLIRQATAINSGTLQVIVSDALPNAGTVIVATGATLDIQSFDDTVGGVSLTGGSIVGTGTLTSTSDLDVRSGFVGVNLAGAVGLVKTTGGTATLAGRNSYTGPTTVAAGVLELGTPAGNSLAGNLAVPGGVVRWLGANQVADAASITVAGGSLDLQSFSDTVAPVTLIDGSLTGTTGTLASTGVFDVRNGSIDAILGGSVGLVKSTGGTVTLARSNTYTDPTVVQAGTLVLAAPGGNAVPGDLLIGDNAGGFGVDAVRLQDNNQVADTATVTVTGSGLLDLGVFADTFALLVETVANTNDSGPATLREAIASSNLSGGPAVINFAIAGAGPYTIRPGSALPAITDRVVIDGTSQPGFTGRPVIELDGSAAGAGVDGLLITAGDSLVQGLVINRFSGNGIVLDNAGGLSLLGNFIGTDSTGNVALGNGLAGVEIRGPGNTVGGTAAGARNIISGNFGGGIEIHGGASGNLVQGNLIGTDVTGTRALGNAFDGVSIGEGSAGNTIGGTAANAGNVTSGNNRSGIRISDSGATGNVVQGNLIGTNITGSADLGNTDNGITLSLGTSSNTIGGTAVNAGNIISGNNGFGIRITDRGTTGNVVQGNLIGTDRSGTATLGNTLTGLELDAAVGNTIGGTVVEARNVISGNERGVALTDGSMGNTIQGNYIGTDVTGTRALGNASDGVWIREGSAGNTIGGTAATAGNIISGNSGFGIRITDRGTTGNV
ncbi:MAG TPA: autotransporter-associated beta strand repeat-containing protein, partial [Isosphaeraceae bacterium]